MAIEKLNKLEINTSYQFGDIHNESMMKGVSIKDFYKSVLVGDTNKAEASIVNDSVEATYIKDETYGLGYFPTNAFELLLQSVHLPISGFFAADRVPIRVGGGAVELVSAFRVQDTAAQMQLAGGNSIPLVAGAVEKYSVPVRPYEAGLRITKLDWRKAQHGNYDIYSHYINALRKSYWFTIEEKAFIGNINLVANDNDPNFYGGLLNQPTTKIGFYKEADTDLETLNLVELMAYFNDLYAAIRQKNRLNPEYNPNVIAVWPSLFTKLTKPATLGTGVPGGEIPVFASVADYLEKQLTRIAKTQVRIVEIPYLSPDALDQGYAFQVAGVNGTGRITVYRQDADMFVLPIPLELTLSPLLFSVGGNDYRQNGLTFIADGLLLHRPNTIAYIDNGEVEEEEEEGTQD